ncbi:TPA: AAA family ATPase [Elizabethkingia anophelis]|uniref:AAA family ATPase n=1 Tax=Elizabethkingia anophelis TaxID=1117645 RepID=UPI001A2015C6|nr:AAA family ATPase [Elizabethkingia anophelis]HAT3999162.1 AAA family ATPase [Elizabethkingia anophelis]HAT4010170.1 AAA family ATPase [Elizabethkingia anophelis]HAY3502275.1 AAA family ATPase [Elizabethkingia anophelis]HAY3509689.1 AAA family ATPase [Elizabethkingia anophelis]
MLIEFRVTNYRSIGNEQVLSLVPSTKQKEFSDNIINKGKFNALNALAIYGANGSGKSNLLLAMGLLDKMVHLSARSTSTTKLPYDPFLLQDGWDGEPTKFEITFFLNESRYRYGVEFLKDEVIKEWLYRKSTGREVILFLREREIIDPSSGFKGNSKIIDLAIEATKTNALFLSTCDMFNIEEAKSIFQWFKNFNVIDGVDTEDEEIRTVTMWDNLDDRESISQYLSKLNLGFFAIDIAKKDFDEADLPLHLSENARSLLIKNLSGSQGYSIKALHTTYSEKGNENKQYISWNFDERESKGSIKALHMSGPVIWALKNGGVLVVDEIEAKMHPLITLATINLFLDKESNPHNAQIIFATHDTNLLSYSDLRRDQIYFTEKNRLQSTEIFSLSDFVYIGDNDTKGKKERPDVDKEKRYFEGRYGAIPFLGNLSLNI